MNILWSSAVYNKSTHEVITAGDGNITVSTLKLQYKRSMLWFSFEFPSQANVSTLHILERWRPNIQASPISKFQVANVIKGKLAIQLYGAYFMFRPSPN